MIFDELRRQADVFTDLVELQLAATAPSARPAQCDGASVAGSGTWLGAFLWTDFAGINQAASQWRGCG
jgi:hypothetical protein